jgi:hypothetical protein
MLLFDKPIGINFLPYYAFIICAILIPIPEKEEKVIVNAFFVLRREL